MGDSLSHNPCMKTYLTRNSQVIVVLLTDTLFLAYLCRLLVALLEGRLDALRLLPVSAGDRRDAEILIDIVCGKKSYR